MGGGVVHVLWFPGGIGVVCMADPPATPPGHWVQCPECLRFFENEQGRGSHRLHAHAIRGDGTPWALPVVSPPQVRAPEPAPAVALEAGPATSEREPVAPTASPTPALTPPEPDPPVVTVKETSPAPPEDLTDAQAASGLSVLAQSLAHTPPPAHMGRFGKAVVVFLVFALSGLALYLVVRELKGANAPQPQPYVIDAARIQPGAPNLTTGDPYWDSLLGYRGRRL